MKAPKAGCESEGTHPVRHAWVDESMRLATPANGRGIYLVAATVADPDLCDRVRDSISHQLVGREPRWHWRTENGRRRTDMGATVAQSPLRHIVVVGAPLDARRQERARRKCMERLYYELHSRGVSRVWVESRDESLNRRDLQMIDALRESGAIGAGMRTEFARPRSEPMLWIPDTVAGAVGAARMDRDSTARIVLGDAVEEIDISLS